MIENLNLLKEGQEDLRIVEHLDLQKLPESVQQMLSLATTPEDGQSAIPKMVGNRLLQTYEKLTQNQEIEWSLTENQKERLGEHLETEYGTLIGLLGDNFHSAVIRMAVQIERMAMILSALRVQNTDRSADRTQTELLCSDADYQTAEMIGNKLLLHMASAYKMIDGDKQDVVPEIKPLDQRKVLFEQLKGEYALGELISEAKSQGVSRSSAIRWNNQWIEQGMIIKENHGNYRKVA